MVINDMDEAGSTSVTPSVENDLDSNTNAVLLELIDHLEDYIPTVPDALTDKYLNKAGLNNVDPRITRVISVTAQKFIADIANDALQHCKTRSNSQHSGGHNANKDKKSNKDRKYTLAVEDLTPALSDHGITIRKPQYFV